MLKPYPTENYCQVPAAIYIHFIFYFIFCGRSHKGKRMTLKTEIHHRGEKKKIKSQPRPLHANVEQSLATSHGFRLLSPKRFGSIHEQRDLTAWHDY